MDHVGGSGDELDEEELQKEPPTEGLLESGKKRKILTKRMEMQMSWRKGSHTKTVPGRN